MDSIIIAIKLNSQIATVCRPPKRGFTLNSVPGGTKVRSAVLTVIIAVAGDANVGETVSGDTWQLVLELASMTEQFSFTDWPLPPMGGTFSVYLADCPADIMGVGVEVVMAKATPVPVTMMTCGLPAPLSKIVTAPMLPIAADGVNHTLITQFVWACSVALMQVSDSEKSPLATTLEIINGLLLLFVTVTVCGLLCRPTCSDPKERLEAESVTEDVLPVRFTT
jgi:hypothetical protein